MREAGRSLLGKARKFFIMALGVIASAVLLSGCGGGLSDEAVQSLVAVEVATALAGIPTPEAGTVASVIQAERFEVVNQDGDVRALLTTLEDGWPSFTLMDENGEFRAWLFLSADGSPNLILVDNSRLILMGGAGEFRALLRLDESGLPSLDLKDETGASRSVLRLSEDRSPTLLSSDGAGGATFSAP
jgi:hypothetical protein